MPTLIRRGPIADASARPDDPPHASTTGGRSPARRRLTAFVALAIAAYALVLVATIPAGVLVPRGPWRVGAGGTIWNGEVGLAGGTRLEWRWAPLASLAGLGFAVDWRATGGRTDVAGRALLRPGTQVVEGVSGALDAAVLQALQPDLPFTCDLAMQADLPRVRLGDDAGIAGRIATDAGSCTARGVAGAAPVAVAPLILTAERIGDESRLTLAPATQRRRTLMTVTLRPGGTGTIAMTAAGAAALPFVGLPAGASVETRL